MKTIKSPYTVCEAGYPVGWWAVWVTPLHDLPSGSDVPRERQIVALFRGEDEANAYVIIMSAACGQHEDARYVEAKRQGLRAAYVWSDTGQVVEGSEAIQRKEARDV